MNRVIASGRKATEPKALVSPKTDQETAQDPNNLDQIVEEGSEDNRASGRIEDENALPSNPDDVLAQALQDGILDEQTKFDILMRTSRIIFSIFLTLFRSQILHMGWI